MKIALMTFLLTLLMTSKAYAEEGVAGISVTLDKLKDIEIVTEDEITVLYQIVEAEATGECIEAKENVASVVFNRLHNKSFPDTITDVVFQENQFTPISDKRYWEVVISEETIIAVNNVIMNGPTSEALYFCNMDKVSKKNRKWFKSLEFLFKDEANHSFFK